MSQQVSREGSNDAKQADVISLADYRERLKPPDGVPEIRFSIKDGELTSTATRITPEHVPMLVHAMAKLSSELTAFLSAAKTAAIGAAFILGCMCIDSTYWPARAEQPPPHGSNGLKEGREKNMHKWLAQQPCMSYHSLQAG